MLSSSLRLRLCWLPFVLCGCTPVGAVSPHADSVVDAGASDAAAPAKRFESGGGACASDGERACEPGDPSRKPLLCEGGLWRGQPACQEDQRCDAEPGATYGTCVKIAADCIGRRPNTEFCAGREVRVCNAGISRVRRSCGDQETCLDKADAVVCECSPGAVGSTGACRVGTSCDTDNGGCDPLTQCSMRGSRRICSACPDGYTGEGAIGCTPLLTALAYNHGELTPMLAAQELSYRLSLPLIQQQITLTPEVAAGVRVEINGRPLAAGAAWSSNPLALGQHSLVIALTGESGLTSRYMIQVERAGTEEAFLTQRSGDQYDSFGWSLALSEDTLAIGVPGDDSSQGGVDGNATDNRAPESGAVYVFVRKSGAWSQQAYLKPSEPRAGGFFGASVAIDGDTLVVGAAGGTYYTVTQAIGYPQRPGSVYVFERRNEQWSQTSEIRSPARNPDKFGLRVALASDSIVVGAPADTEDGDEAGAVYLVPRNASASAITKLRSPQPTAGSMFGFSVAEDRGTLLVGAPHSIARNLGPGAVFAFAYNTTTQSWQPAGQLTSTPNSQGSAFGWSIALQGDVAAIGAPRATTTYGDSATAQVPHGDVFVFQRAAERWTQSAQLQSQVPRNTDFFGIDVALAGDALVVTASGDSNSSAGFDANPQRSDLPSSGAFYLFAGGASTGTWTQTSYVKSSKPTANGLFAHAVEIAGETLAIGAVLHNGAATGSGAVHVFR